MSEDKTETSAITDSKIRVIETFLATMSEDEDEISLMLISILGRKIIRSTLLGLWGTYTQGNFEENGFEKDQFELLFHKYDAVKDPLQGLTEVLNLMVTGNPKTVPPKTPPVNFFPCGFWSMSEVQWELTNQTLDMVEVMLKSVCSLHYEMPEDWQDDKHPEGLFISLKDQTKALADALIERVGEIKIAQAEDEVVDSNSSADAVSAEPDEDETAETTD